MGLELWGGVECTVNRVGDLYFDQMRSSGHDARPDDLDRFAELGVSALRHPVLWEHIAPDGPERCDWSWADARLARLRRLGLRPIVGLIHHGSGPRTTNLLDPGFAEGLAAHAAHVARRYPWLEMVTPVNEPLTTARFSALYGHWYPHARDGVAFARAMLSQCRAVVLAMRAIREECPNAKLVQTEDMGKTHATPALRYQADFENERRWLTFDLLCGRVDRHHPIGAFFLYLGLAESELAWFRDHPCPPDILGVNYYLTGERFLDERLERYPLAAHGGNGRHAYADVEAVRVGVFDGPESLFREVWQRYRLPLAITEVHLGGGREEQMRWLLEAWRAATRLRSEGADLRAVTPWALVGSFDWDSLLTRPRGRYESGAFDVRGPTPRRTALGAMFPDLAAGREPHHPVLAVPGWWHRAGRACFPLAEQGSASDSTSDPLARPLLVAGAGGGLGRAFTSACAARGLPGVFLRRREMDVTCAASVEAALERYAPWAVINASGYGHAESRPDANACRQVNVHGASILAMACARRGVPLLTFSCDAVFDGLRRAPYRESDPVDPLCVFGQTKVDGEREVLRLWPNALVVRTGPIFGTGGEHDPIDTVSSLLEAGGKANVPDDQTVSPTYAPDLVRVSLDLLIDGERGIWHLANRGAVTWLAAARAAARGMGFDEAGVEGRRASALGWPPRPPYSALSSERGQLLPTFDDALARCLAESAGRRKSRVGGQVGDVDHLVGDDEAR
jgi:dTDP-4-dehydrorhamnose reductase